MAFTDEKDRALDELIEKYPAASLTEKSDEFQKNALDFFDDDWSKPQKMKLHLKGTAFQLKVWETLLKIPTGQLTTYGELAKSIDKPKASRAVGTAIGNNPIAFLIPCHRVIQSSGLLGGYMWGTNRKAAIIGWEAAQLNG
jgi:AraC family transcriptional regulator, regulatory protein of adaptative response / methylated-DNA-[protein]-cysteine methyltransferase